MSWFPEKEQAAPTMIKVGDRIGAVMRANDTHIWLIGYGVFDGGIPDHPRLKIDGGRYICGCQCWWTKESTVLKETEQRIVEDVGHLAKFPNQGY